MALGDIDASLVLVTPGEPQVFRGRDNVVTARFFQYDGNRQSPMDFSAVTRMALVLTDPDNNAPLYLFDSATNPDAFDWVSASLPVGAIVFKLTQYALPVGVYPAQLLAYDTQHPHGQVVTGQDGYQQLRFDVIEVVPVGLPPPPLPSGGEVVSRAAGEPLSALRAVYELDGRVYALDNQDAIHAPAYLGVALTAASAIGDEVLIQRSGTLSDASWTWTPSGEVFVGASGSLTQTPPEAPTAGFKLIVGTASSATQINLTYDTPVYL